VDVVVTERGIAINPRRDDLIESVKNMNVVSIEELYKKARGMAGEPRKPKLGKDIIAVIEYRDGTVLDTVRSVKGW